jgi:hypothetical protein
MPYMWQTHFIILGVLVALALPVYLLDYFLLKPSGDIFLLNLRSMLITAYAAWLAVHIPLSSLALWLLKTDRVLTLHVLSAITSAALLFIGLQLVEQRQATQARVKHDARMAMRQGFFDTIKLEKWWYVPQGGKPGSIGAVFATTHSGRLAAHVSGRTQEGVQVFSGELRPQRRVMAGERIEHTFALQHYSDGAAPDVRFTFYLFRDKTGSAPEDIYKEYAAIAQKRDDGKYFLDVLPPPAPPPSPHSGR